MKIAFGMIVLNGNYVLKEVLESIYPYANQILIAEGPVSWWQAQGVTTSTDGTNELIDNFPDPENKITIVHSIYKEKDEQCQAYMQHFKEDNDYIWNIDSDEIFKKEDIEKIIELLDKEKYTTVAFKSLSFYGGFDDVISGFEEEIPFIRIRKIYPGSYWFTHRPPTIAHRPGIQILPEKLLDFNTLASIYGIRMYHYSYVFPDQVSQKIKYYKGAVSKEACIDDYFNEVYLPWVLTKDRKKRFEIEKKYNGVHEFKPGNRSQAYTRKFNGEHPNIILKALDTLKNKFKEQLEKYIIK